MLTIDTKHPVTYQTVSKATFNWQHQHELRISAFSAL